MSQFRAELEQSRGLVEALEAERRQLQEEEQQRRQERDEARSQAQTLTEQLDNTEVGPQIPEKSVKIWEFGAFLLLSDMESIGGHQQKMVGN